MKVTVGNVLAGIVGGFGFMLVGSFLIAMVCNNINPLHVYYYTNPILWFDTSAQIVLIWAKSG